MLPAIQGMQLLEKNGLNVKGKPDNKSDRYMVAVKKDGIIIGHLLREISLKLAE